MYYQYCEHIDAFIDLMLRERKRQEDLHGHENETNTPERWVSILGEEFGEVCAAVQRFDVANMEEELIHVSTVCFAFYQRIQNSKLYRTTEVKQHGG